MLFFRPEPHILLFRRALGTDPVTGKINTAVAAQAKASFDAEYSGAAERK
jgi:cyclin-dependent kinase regulatory subunit CKS1